VHVLRKNAGESPSERDGTPILVDRLWPRGLKKADAGTDVWHREVAPSDALREDLAHRLGEEAAS
jgi:uncharacterized protein YeaO (DUF488 family)